MSSSQIYSAKYSGVDVYEFIHPTGSIMKRKTDGWVNATHILKAANFPKAKRTRILEREVIKDTHEKVQGGFGKYQGTWVPLEIAKRLAEKFEVIHELKPLFDFTQEDGSASPPRAPKHHHAPKSDSAKKRGSKNVSGVVDKTGDSYNPSKPLVPHAPKKRGRPPREKQVLEEPKISLSKSQNDVIYPRPSIPSSTITTNQLPSIHSPLDKAINLDISRIREQPFKELNIDDGLSSDIEENNKIIKHRTSRSSSSSLPSSSSGFSTIMPFDQRVGTGTSPITTMLPRFSTQFRSQTSDINFKINEYLSSLVDYFISNDDQNDNIPPAELLNPPLNASPLIDTWIDQEHHTAFHWACAMGDLPIIDVLLQAGSNIHALNKYGETPLMRSSIFHNSYTKRSYLQIFQLLKDTVFELDLHSQSLIHHIVKRKSSAPSATYYLDIVLSKIKDSLPQYRIKSLINQQDDKGNTALHISAKNGDIRFLQTLVNNGALSTIKNQEGLTPTEIWNKVVGVSHQLISNQEILSNNFSPLHTINLNGESSLYYSSKAAANIIQYIPEVVKLMKATADSYQIISKARNEDIVNLEKTLKSISKTISSVEHKIMTELESNSIDNNITTLTIWETKIKDLKEKLSKLKKYALYKLEKNQSERLNELIKRADFLKDGESEVIKEEKIDLLRSISLLQISRKRKINKLLKVQYDNSKIFKYRKMISQGTDMEPQEVDKYLDMILKTLTNENHT